MSKLAFHAIQNTGRKQGSECIADEASAGKQCSSLTKLPARVPFREQKQSTWEESCLNEAKKESRQKGADEVRGGTFGKYGLVHEDRE